MSCFGRITSQVRLGFVSKNNASKYCQVADDFPGLPMGVWMERAAFWAAVREGTCPTIKAFVQAVLLLVDYISAEPRGLILAA